MFFFFKSKPIIVDAFTYDQAHAESYPIVEASKYLPNWWKELPMVTNDPTFSKGHALAKTGTMKRCRGFIDMYNNSFILPLWSDVSIEMYLSVDGVKQWRYNFSDNISNLEVHHESQFTNFIDYQKYQHIKFQPRWKLKESKGIKFYVTHPTWNMGHTNFKFQVLPGVLNFKYQTSIAINTLWKYPDVLEKIDSTLLEADTPLAHIIPLTDKPVNIKTHIVTQEEFNRHSGSTSKFSGIYRENKKIIDRNEKSKCPFHMFHK
jgi:hypothetical protein